ncbi:uncharacterized protein LOC113312799 [Papaver somniferum]|uniref:uncharacterized protein LOC113312799 n=1 Tax=Papaver somniferum TaxID=3469 RepID=UPI000E705373|nr:uncharacterized protein LOC113312799 [Papaver somniferum]
MAQDKQKEKMDMKDIQTQMDQLANIVSKLEAQAAGKIPSQPLNHRDNVSVVELQSGKQIEKPEALPESHERDLEKEVDEAVPKKDDSITHSDSKPLISTYVTPPPFPSRFAKSKKETLDREIWDIFKKIEVNIPLIEAIRQVARYAKFLKELCTNKHKLTDLGASISVTPASIYESLNLGPLKSTSIVIQLADRSNVYPKGVVENVLVQVNELIFPIDFYVLDMSDENSSSSTPLLLGKPFMRTDRTKIDVFEGTLTIEFDGEVVRFNIFEVMRYPSDVYSFFVVEETDTG